MGYCALLTRPTDWNKQFSKHLFRIFVFAQTSQSNHSKWRQRSSLIMLWHKHMPVDETDCSMIIKKWLFLEWEEISRKRWNFWTQKSHLFLDCSMSLVSPKNGVTTLHTCNVIAAIPIITWSYGRGSTHIVRASPGVRTLLQPLTILLNYDCANTNSAERKIPASIFNSGNSKQTGWVVVRSPQQQCHIVITWSHI